MKRDFISLSTFSQEEIEEIFSLTCWLKEKPRQEFRPLANKTAALIFEKPSLRTHVSFGVGIAQLGGQSLFLSQQHIGLSTRESVRDVAEVLSRYNNLIVARTMEHATVEDLATHATIPVINALTDVLHPCQIIADAYTLRERGLLSEETKITFIGDGNNVVNSWLELAEKIPFHFVLACPEGYEPDAQILDHARKANLSRIEILRDPFEAATDADVLYTDVWVSMGQENDEAARQKAFQSYQINSELLRVARPNCVVMHCLPAHRGQEITADVLEGSQSIVLEEAENRLHVQKAIMAYLIGNGEKSSVDIQTHSEILTA
ncbi:MAG: ornithine carbamoyltransferase [Ignavibacteria bacterium]|nr:ornithine carbamoyltransferase [Ignavibacteria bacterium]MBI3765287.1 ornithine carbamoyltransferase [Ignavibacteriales bacterium]